MLSPVIFTEELELGDLSWDGTDYTNLHTLQLMKFDLNGEMIAENILGQQGDYSGSRSTLGHHDRWTCTERIYFGWDQYYVTVAAHCCPLSFITVSKYI